MELAAPLLAVIAYPDIDPILFSIGPVAIRWYGLAYLAGILLGWQYARFMISRTELWPAGRAPLTRAALDDFVFWVALGIIAGGRIGYILFYDFAAVAANPLRALEIWNGGMSFHGGLLGTGLAIVWFARRNSIPLRSMADLVAAVVPIGLFFGRLANFINGELWGRVSDAPWAMIFPSGGPVARHPSQLYEAGLEGLVLLLLLAWLIFSLKKLRAPGFVTGVFVAFYALSRILVEFFREPDPHLGYLAGGWLTMGMVLSLPMIAVGIWFMLSARTGAAVPAER
ncbi:prolipoprotein diacylglyceryl transferase [Pseudohoeflea coraliihabitans]|uniref:Phosphatidylglycerol--prolipoprotein diacylglyceryl transferase n=1 Tax=Pseudohoeflea coraliihabitans TaxID=2860393 RepID=A0ABS6WJH9_9HYPH|nr:prolipoprotein diacylglyceryl transferase [Pseudohoeflea sp. DP4N28-3]MBW3096098.1 prolipoprotein diacylglyceryl transferase [Pseudohoeflea sp. DP4N28-3]